MTSSMAFVLYIYVDKEYEGQREYIFLLYAVHIVQDVLNNCIKYDAIVFRALPSYFFLTIVFLSSSVFVPFQTLRKVKKKREKKKKVVMVNFYIDNCVTLGIRYSISLIEI